MKCCMVEAKLCVCPAERSKLFIGGAMREKFRRDVSANEWLHIINPLFVLCSKSRCTAAVWRIS
jgi:hypothetical protein